MSPRTIGLIALAVAVLAAAAITLSLARNSVGEILEGTGTIEATEVRVGTKVLGRIQELLVREGDTVKAGQVIARLEGGEYKAAVERDRASVAKAEAQLAELLAGARDQEIKEARAAVATAAANLEKARLDWERYQELFGEGALSSLDRDAAVNRHQVAQEQHKAAEERLSLLLAGARPEAIQAARWEVARAKAALGASQVTLDDTVIRAPISGLVLTKAADQGETVLPGASIAVMIDPQDLWIRVYIAESDIGKIRLGQKARIRVDSFPDRSFGGKVIEIASKAEFTPKNVQTKKERVHLVFGVKIALENPEGHLKPGMPADAEILVGGTG
ncbi:MAG TPA: efflux RND transporter periplasmic adaptor subunit [Candidatus Methylomirabilis sp.]